MDAKQATNSTPLGVRQSSALTEHANGNLAAFYTPQKVAQILTDWAITDGKSLVLDPSYGGCSFLNAAFSSLLKKGSQQPEKQVFGVDIDPSARKYLNNLFDAGAATQQYVNKDFFEIDIADLGGQLFDALVGNPPYIRYHDIPSNLQRRAVTRLAQFGIRISARASYWAYFLLYSIHLLRDGGRLAMLLPGAILHTDYSAHVRELLISRFERVTIYLLQERIFHGTQEESVIICAEGAGRENSTVCVNHVSTVEELSKAFEDVQRQTRTVNGKVGDGGWLRAFTDDRSLQIYDELTADSQVVRLGDWVEARIGIVTGNNNFFIISRGDQQRRNIPEKYFVPVIRRPGYISGLVATNRDLQLIKKQGKDCLLLNPPPKLWQMPKSLRKYIEQGEEEGVHLACKCKSREPWYIVPQTYVPSAFIPCMSASWPRVIVNRSGYTCTNNIIRLSWKGQRKSTDWTRLALGSLSTLSQLSAELVGRSYGGGVLKLEPTELTRLAIPLIPQDVIQALARSVDNLLRQNKQGEATNAIDNALLDVYPNLTKKKLALLRSARDALFLRRRQHRNDAEKIVRSD
jgi:adenine-specific DNA-methyltransferase